jgi:subtilisin-like proprotein convertase family protein
LTFSHDENEKIEDLKTLTVQFSVVAPKSILVDYVTVEADIVHNMAGDLRISLTSPSGTVSVFSVPKDYSRDKNSTKVFSFEFFI